jgi:four helix bundle protein
MLSDFQVYKNAKEMFRRCTALEGVPEFLHDQLNRASSSVVLNIAEGSGRRTPGDQKRFYSNALGSLRECQAALELAEITDPEILKLMDGLGAMLFTLSKPDFRQERRSKQEEGASGI